MEPQTSETPAELPASLRMLKGLVTVLTVVMIGGVVTVVFLLVMRLGATPPALPETITLPEGARAIALTQADGWYAVVTDTQEILIYDRLTGVLKQKVDVLD